jgi:integrase
MKKATLQKAIDDVYLFKDFVNEKNLAIRTTRLYIAVIQSWFTDNNLQIPKNKSREIRGPIKPTTDDKAFTTETAKKTFDQMTSPASRCLFLFLLSTGCRVGEALQVKLSDVNWEEHPVSVNLDETTTKTGEGRQVFLTSEAANYIKRVWLIPTDEGGKIQSNRERFLNAAKNKARGLIAKGIANERPRSEDDDRLWPFGITTTYMFISTAIRRAGFNEKTKTGKQKLHIHSTRKFFRTVFGMTAGPDAAETLLGHSPGLTATYRRLEKIELIKKWNESETALWINISPEARLAMQTKDMNSAAIVELREKNEQLTKKLSQVTNLLKKIAGDVDNDADFLVSARLIDASLEGSI